MMKCLMSVLMMVSSAVFADVSLVEQDNGKIVNVELGQEIKISLFDNNGAPYTWTLLNYDEIFVNHGRTYIVPEGNVVGGTVKVNFALFADKIGSGRIHLVKCKPWDCKNTIIENFEITVQINEQKEETIEILDSNKILGFESNNKKFSIEKNQEIKITLNEIAGTPYTWKLLNFDEIFVNRGRTYTVPQGDVVGGMVKVNFSLLADKVGDGIIQIVKCRPWECKNSIIEKFEISVYVTEQ